MLEEKAYGKDLEELRAKLGLDRPIHIQYASGSARCRAGSSASRCGHGNRSCRAGRRLPVTLTLGFMALAVAVLIGVPVGLIAAVRQDGPVDFVMRSAAILGLSIPGS